MRNEQQSIGDGKYGGLYFACSDSRLYCFLYISGSKRAKTPVLVFIASPRQS
ncbi:hypothetical protein [Saccharicrinis carchari]|uniref:hypothetical protein n=1 Tax=Saccharicrinis carchari TaxID=1168039 RepID=UPI00163D52E4|nr:hypothetical protein [Saccharicrinis carchari]